MGSLRNAHTCSCVASAGGNDQVIYSGWRHVVEHMSLESCHWNHAIGIMSLETCCVCC